MELLMETKLNFLSLLFLMFVISACNVVERQTSQKQTVLTGSLHGTRSGASDSSSSKTMLATKTMQSSALSSSASPLALASASLSDAEMKSLLHSLDELAELERTGSWFQGMFFVESGIRETIGDLAGAVAAAYKELSCAYGLGLIQKEDVERGLLNVLDAKSEEIVVAAAITMIAFLNEQWADAAIDLSFLFDDLDEPDSFSRWMMLVCSLEKNKASSRNGATAAEDRLNGSAYRAIRARYAHFPEYWYRGARFFYGAIAAEFAENCINLAPYGPFAEECRRILASYTGLKTEDGLSIKTKREIENIISLSINSGNPQILDSLLSLISLPDNPYTVFAVGALRSSAGIPGFREYFNKQAAASSGRLAERLTYISL